ncbi:glycosyltransferase [Flavobacteriaceae bacterium]|nr:glycosyltransferase [Flavobacteriaceae bacterium]
MKQPLVSIIISCYNQAHCITNTLESIVAQTYTNWECIIVDDGSMDTSAVLIKEFIKDDTRFTYLFQNNQGVSVARNTGFKLASGIFVNFLDGDDTFLPNKLKEQVQVFEDNPEIAVCICDHQFYLEKQEIFKYYEFEKLTKKPLEQILFKWHNGVAFPPHAVLYKRELWTFNELPFPEDYNHRCEDWVFNVLVALKDVNYYMLDKVLCNYHMADTNYTNNTKNLTTAAIKAALYLKPKLPKKYQEDFIDTTIDNSLNMYLESEKINILQQSANWRIANAVSKPLISFLKRVKK